MKRAKNHCLRFLFLAAMILVCPLLFGQTVSASQSGCLLISSSWYDESGAPITEANFFSGLRLQIYENSSFVASVSYTELEENHSILMEDDFVDYYNQYDQYPASYKFTSKYFIPKVGAVYDLKFVLPTGYSYVTGSGQAIHFTYTDALRDSVFYGGHELYASYKVCTPNHTHSYQTTITKATFTKDGKVTKTCSCGSSSTNTISRLDSVTLSATKYVYDGKTKKPSVTVKDSAGTVIDSSNYTVTYSNGRKKPGKYTVKVTFKGYYSGTTSRTFQILPEEANISRLTSVSKGFTVKFTKRATQTTGYQVQYSTSKKFSSKVTKTIRKSTTTSATCTGLKPKTRYYVRVRTYKTVNGTKYYSPWSSAKSIVTK